MSKPMRALRFESLEQKQLLAGDVTVSVVQGVLTLQGDELANQVAVSSGEEPGSFIIRGLDDTQIILGDAEPASEVRVEGVRALGARLGDGDDVLRIQDASIRGNVLIGMGEGNDHVAVGVGPVSAPSEANDSVSVKLGSNLVINTADGNDVVTVINTSARGGLSITTGAGDDAVQIARPQSTSPEAAETENEYAVNFRRGVIVGLGDGDDTLNVFQLRGNQLHVHGGDGADTVRLANVHTHAISVAGGRGDSADEVAIHNSTTQLLFASLGGGDDSLTLGGVKARLAVLSGGPGDGDTLTLLGENMIRHRLVSGFETINRPEVTPALARRG